MLPLDGCQKEVQYLYNIENRLTAMFCKLKSLFSGLQGQKDFKLYVVWNKSR